MKTCALQPLYYKSATQHHISTKLNADSSVKVNEGNATSNPASLLDKRR